MSATAMGNRLKRIWAQLPENDWLSEESLDDKLIELSGAYEGDRAHASALRSMLLTARALTARPTDGTRDWEYQRAPWTDWPSALPGSESYNEELRRLHEDDMRRLDAERLAAFEASPFGVQRREIVALIEQTVERPVDERIGSLLASLDGSSVARLRERLIAANARNTQDEAGDGRHEGEDDE